MKHIGQIMLARESGEFDGIRRSAHDVATHQFEQGRLASLSHPLRTNMACARDPRLHAVDERNRSIDFAEGP